MEKEFVTYELAVKLKALGFDEPCLASYETAFGKGIDFELGYIIDGPKNYVLAPTFSQAINFLYICSNKQIDIELKASDTYEERLRKITKGCEDLRNLQNNKSN